MNLDIVEIGLNLLTDSSAFEKLASELMREEGYHDIKPLGGVSDQGQDAIQDKFYQHLGRTTRTVFQYTLEDYIEGKFRDTIKKLEIKKIDYSMLVIVTPVRLSAERQTNLKKLAREECEVALDIYERKTLLNRLSDFSNGIFHRYFPSIENQITALLSSKPVFTAGRSESEIPMLKVSIAFVFGKGVEAVRKSVFDQLVLASIMSPNTDGVELSVISNRITKSLGCGPFPDPQILAAIHRLEIKGFVRTEKTRFHLTDQAASTVESATIEANALTNSLISDIVEEVSNISEIKFSTEDRNRLERNVKDILAELFRLMGLELANQFLEKGNPVPLYLESSTRILELAKRQTNNSIGELLVAVLANMIQHPSEEQSKILANWARAYIGECVMNLDPALREFQATRLRSKIFILDTDFALRCIIKEHPSHMLDLTILERLNDLGCRLIIPPAVINECVIHATLALSNYHKFKGISLMGLTPEFVHMKVNNIFVQGYYYGIKGLLIPPKQTFQDYLDNYHDAENPTRFFIDVIEGVLPSKVEIIDPESLLVKGPPDSSMIEEVRTELLKLLEKSPKSEFRTPEQRQQLALTDARIFVAALQLSSEQEDQISGRILGGACYVITDSGRYLRAAKELKIRDVVTTRPQQLVTLLELMAGPMADDAAIIQLFDNPMLNHAVEEVWDDVRILLNNGIGLSGKSLARLRWDLGKKLHERISALKIAEDRAEAEGTDADMDAGDREYVQLLEDATSLGYPPHVILESLNEALAQAKSEAETQRIAKEQLQEKLDLFSTEIEHFGKRKQRYLKRIIKK